MNKKEKREKVSQDQTSKSGESHAIFFFFSTITWIKTYTTKI
jgi:hypothetical protein